MFRSTDLQPAQIDYLYSELVVGPVVKTPTQMGIQESSDARHVVVADRSDLHPALQRRRRLIDQLRHLRNKRPRRCGASAAARY